MIFVVRCCESPLADVRQCTLAACGQHLAFYSYHAVLGGPSHKPRIGCQSQGVQMLPLWVLLCFLLVFNPYAHAHSLYICMVWLSYVIMFFLTWVIPSPSLFLIATSNATDLMQRHNRMHMVLRAWVCMLALAHALRSHLRHFPVSKSHVHVVKYIEAKRLFMDQMSNSSESRSWRKGQVCGWDPPSISPAHDHCLL